MNSSLQRILITGAAGFIGANALARLSKSSNQVMGIDSYSDYYNPRIKRLHLESENLKNFVLDVDICDKSKLMKIYSDFEPTVVIHLAAQGGVRASQLDPAPYIQTNQQGFLNLLELNNRYSVPRFLYASSSSVYGEGLPAPFKEEMNLPSPKSLYAASKITNELMGQHYPNISFGQRVGLRFFTVYGPWGRPDMAVSKLLASGLKGNEFTLTANLDLVRDFTFVEDVVDVLEDLVLLPLREMHTILNVAGESPRKMRDLLEIVKDNEVSVRVIVGEENKLDVALTHGSTLRLHELNLRIPQTSLETGIRKTIEWLKLPLSSEVLTLL